MEQITEIWVDIKGYETKYQISSFGNVKSLARMQGYGKGYLKPEQILKPQKDTDGYLMVNISAGGRRSRSLKIHQLVANHFIGIIPQFKGFEVCHRDGNKTNNHVSNLYIGSGYTNLVDKYTHGRTKLSINDVREIKESTEGYKILATRYGVKPHRIWEIRVGRGGKVIRDYKEINEQAQMFETN